MPAHTAPPAAYRRESFFWNRLLALDDGDLHFWHGVTPFPGAEVDLCLLDLKLGAFCLEIKAVSLNQLKHVDLQLFGREDGGSGPSPFGEAVSTARALGVVLDQTWEERPDFTPVAAFPFISRNAWVVRFDGEPAAEFVDRCILREDLESLETFRTRLQIIAANPVGTRRRSEVLSELKEDAVRRMDAAVAPYVPPERTQEGDLAQTPVLCVLGEVVDLVGGPGAHYGAPGLDSLTLWGEALTEHRERLRVSVVGEFKAGKSTLINALLGRDVCFVDEFEATTVAASYVQGDEDTATFVLEDGSRETCSIPEFLERCAKRETAGVREVVVALASGLPFDICDTPGLGSYTAGHADQAEQEIRRTDFLLWAVDSNDPGSAREGAFIHRARELGLPILVVLTKADLQTPEDLQQITEYLAAETGVPASDILAVSALRTSDEADHGIHALSLRLLKASENREATQRSAYVAKVQEAVSGSRSVLRYLLEINAPHARFLAAERGYLEGSAAGIGRAGRTEWLRLLREECGQVVKSLELHSSEDAKIAETVLAQALPEAVERATNRFLQSLRRLVRDEWRSALEERSREFERRLSDLLISRPDATADLAFLRTQRDEFRQRAEVIATEADSGTTYGGRLWVVGIGAAASVLTVSFVPLAIAGVVAGLALLDPKSRGGVPSGADTIVAAKIEDALVSSYDHAAETVERSIERIVGDIAIRSLIKLVNRRGGPDFHTILVIERKASGLIDDLATLT